MPKFIKEPSSKRVFRDTEARFEALVQSQSKVTVAWKVNGNVLSTKQGVKFEKDVQANRYALIVPRANANFGQSILCEVSNEHGTVAKQCDLFILGKSALTLASYLINWTGYRSILFLMTIYRDYFTQLAWKF